MKKWQILTLTLLMMVLPSFSPVQAASQAEPQAKSAQYKDQIKVKRQIIKGLQKANKKIEKQNERKLKEIDGLMLYLPENRVIGQKSVENQFDEMEKSIKNQFNALMLNDQFIWEQLDLAKKKVAEKNFEAGISYLDKATEALEKKHEMLIVYDKALADFLEFIKQLEYK